MRHLLAAAAGALLLTGVATSGAGAMPVAPADTVGANQAATLVRDGCGPGRFRTPFGACRPFGWRGGPGFGPRRFYGGPRRCFIRETPYGPRRICRF